MRYLKQEAAPPCGLTVLLTSGVSPVTCARLGAF